MVEITIKGRVPSDPRQRVLAMEAAAKAICQSVGADPVDAVFCLMVAAVHLTTRNSDKLMSEIGPAMATALGHAIVAADDFFNLREVAK